MIFVCKVPPSPGKVPSTPVVFLCPFCSLDCPFFCWSCPLFPKSYAHLRMVTHFTEGVTPFADGLHSFPRDLQGLRRPTPLPRVGGTLECGLGMNMLLWEVAGDESSRWCRMYALWCPPSQVPDAPRPAFPDPGSQIRDPGSTSRRAAWLKCTGTRTAHTNHRPWCPAAAPPCSLYDHLLCDACRLRTSG